MIGRKRHVRFAVTVLLLLALHPTPADTKAQTPCDYGSAAVTIDSGNAVATLTNDSNLFWPIGTSLPQFFEVPKGSEINIFSYAKPWVGGMSDGEFRFTGSTSSSARLFPGPLDQNGTGVANCSDFDRIWKVTRSDLEALEQSGLQTQDIADWPWYVDAPTVISPDGDEIYHPATGDHPAIVGQESAWWIMNDGGRAEIQSLWTPQIGLEMRVLAAAMPSTPGVEVFYFRYTFRYANTSPLTNSYIGFYFDPDLGYFASDKFASDSLLSTAIVYKKENYDAEYGENPPALGITLLSGPLVDTDGKDNNGDGSVDEINERLRLTAFVGSDDVDEGGITSLYYNHLKGLCGYTGEPVRNGSGCVQNEGPITRFWYSGDPVAGTGWLDDRDSDKYFLISSGPFDWLPNQEHSIELAVIWARGSDNLDSISRVRTIAELLLDTPDYFSVGVSSDQQGDEPTEFALAQAYPNPFNPSTRIAYTLPRPANVQFEVFDILGKRVQVIDLGFQTGGDHEVTFDATRLPSGIYLYTLTAGVYRQTRKMVLAK